MALGSVIIQSQSLASSSETRHTAPLMKATDVAVDGSVVEYYPGFLSHMRTALKAQREIGEEGEAKITISLAKDGSSVGAAIIALVAAEQTSPEIVQLNPDPDHNPELNRQLC
ncbi:hypothetical protein F5Y19DRAFT_7318 [Xylariaceae sp. FL1651]|nr:hypothetical protein F5Y19DRAFT_7318 [Xylariaceae sp. FL1651]